MSLSNKSGNTSLLLVGANEGKQLGKVHRQMTLRLTMQHTTTFEAPKLSQQLPPQSYLKVVRHTQPSKYRRCYPRNLCYPRHTAVHANLRTQTLSTLDTEIPTQDT
jgi:hypothetical protein